MIAKGKMPFSLLAAAGFIVAAQFPVAAQAGTVDDRLKAMDTPYEVDEDGDYKIQVGWDKEQRSQIVFVGGRTEEVAGLTIREVFAPAAIIDKHGITPETAMSLLEEAGGIKLGSWEVRGGVVYFVAKVFDSMTAKELDAVIAVVAETADDKEEVLAGGTDDL